MIMKLRVNGALARLFCDRCLKRLYTTHSPGSDIGLAILCTFFRYHFESIQNIIVKNIVFECPHAAKKFICAVYHHLMYVLDYVPKNTARRTTTYQFHYSVSEHLRYMQEGPILQQICTEWRLGPRGGRLYPGELNMHETRDGDSQHWFVFRITTPVSTEQEPARDEIP